MVDGDTIEFHRADFRTSTQPLSESTNGLKKDDTFQVRALYDLSSVLDLNDNSYNVRLRDRSSPGTNDDQVRLGVRRQDDGTVGIAWRALDNTTGIVTGLDFDLLAAGHDQILLVLDHQANTGLVTASYAYVDGANVGMDVSLTDSAAFLSLAFVNMTGSSTIFEGENFTRAGVQAIQSIPVPEPARLAIFGLGLAGLGLMRRRRAA